jgi:hypothetical protein
VFAHAGSEVLELVGDRGRDFHFRSDHRSGFDRTGGAGGSRAPCSTGPGFEGSAQNPGAFGVLLSVWG